ncbi:hypothetical protein G4B88_008679 [Cannabis sativa]|uniref:Uncharacterized protein n=1 Tax=Cannabis sativa TaxID=3483 RepID=A0A7J6ELV1_CANSA|nr:hypothetical protein G4B88_008679 [Cannabis sativa]
MGEAILYSEVVVLYLYPAADSGGPRFTLRGVPRVLPTDRPAYEDVRSPYYLSNADHPGFALETPVLTDRNFHIFLAKDPEFETFYTKNILLNDGIRVWMTAQDQPHEKFISLEEVLPRGNTL